jgi:hypothetical protein
MIPRRFEPFLFGFLLSGAMSLLVAGIATWRAVGLDANFAPMWMKAWVTAWAFAFPVVLVVAPLARRFVGALVARD